MNVVQQDVLIIPSVDDGEAILKKLEAIGRICYDSHDKTTEDSYIKFIENIIKRKHLSVLEHENFNIIFRTDRGVMSELTRHRLASFSIASTRYIDYTKKDMKFILPVKFNSPDPSREEIRQFVIWKRSCSQSEENYIEMMKLGASPQEARACLNNSLLTTIAMTANIRELRHIIELRTASGAHPQMIDLIKKLHNKLKEFIPIVFDDL